MLSSRTSVYPNAFRYMSGDVYLSTDSSLFSSYSSYYSYGSMPPTNGYQVTIHGKAGIGIEKWAENNNFLFEPIEETPEEGYTVIRFRVNTPSSNASNGYAYYPSDAVYYSMRLNLNDSYSYYSNYDSYVYSSTEMKINTGTQTGIAGTLQITDVNPYYYVMPDNTVWGDGLFNIEFGKVNVISLDLVPIPVEEEPETPATTEPVETTPTETTTTEATTEPIETTTEETSTDPVQPSEETPTEPVEPSEETPTDPVEPSEETPTDPVEPSEETPTDPVEPSETTPEETPTEFVPEGAKFGDADYDGRINAVDATAILIKAAAIGAGQLRVTEDLLKIDDIDGKGSIDAGDASFVLQYAAAVGSGVEITFEDFLLEHNIIDAKKADVS